MSGDTETTRATRRDDVKHGGAVVGDGLLPGRAGDGASGPTATTTDAATGTTGEPTATDTWDGSDTEGMSESVAPLSGSTVFRKLPFHGYRSHDLYEAFEKLATEERRPGEEATVALLDSGSSPEEGEFFAMDPTTAGSEKEQYRDLGVCNALPESSVAADRIGYEQLLDADPDVVVFHSAVGLTDDEGDFSPHRFEERFVRPMEEDPIGSRLTAVQEGRVYPGAGGRYRQGPTVHLFRTELAARQRYPDEFGAFDPGRFPSAPEDEQPFDRERVTDVTEGEIRL